MAPIVRGMALETYVKGLGPSTAGKSLSQLKLEAEIQTGVKAESIR